MNLRLCTLALLLCFSAMAGAATLNNDDSCDIAVMPAATLLLPYFDVDLDTPGRTTIFSITNVTNEDRIARVTLWTDRSYPVFNFNIYLTGYDVQAINLYDVLVHGVIGTPAGTGTSVSKRGRFSDPNPSINLTSCATQPGVLDASSAPYMQAALTEGKINGCTEAGGVHEHATGYLTVDVVRNCGTALPTERKYWTEDIAFDNVLTGEFHQVDSTNDFAQGEPMVHIRAIPEGGGTTPLPRTFYSRYVPADLTKGFDGRQPLPSIFAARWIQGSSAQFRTSFKIWREGRSGLGANCTTYAADGRISYPESVRFDEAENGVADVPITRPFPPPRPTTSATSLLANDDTQFFPQLTNGAVGGWLYFNLNDCDPGTCSDAADATQSWVVVSMRAEGRYSADTPAVMLGNGCSRGTSYSEIGVGLHVIAPAPNVRP